MEWHPSGVTRTRIRVFWVNFSEFLIKGKEMWFKRVTRVIRVRDNRVKMTEKCGEIQRKLEKWELAGSSSNRRCTVYCYSLHLLSGTAKTRKKFRDKITRFFCH